MTHYLLRLCLPSKVLGKPSEILKEVHKDVPRWEYGWSRQLHAQPALYVFAKICALPDTDCVRYEARKAEREAHEDDVEAEVLHGTDA